MIGPSHGLAITRHTEAVQKRNPHIRLVSEADREADFYELFEYALRDPKGPGLLVRAKNNRQLEDEQERLFETAMALPPPCSSSNSGRLDGPAFMGVAADRAAATPMNAGSPVYPAGHHFQAFRGSAEPSRRFQGHKEGEFER